MIQSLSIRNFALIQEADLLFPGGFIAITGETGSGKSILLGALNLILGERADYSVIRDSNEKTIVEANFRIDEQYREWFDENELDYEPVSLIRREITSQGKSRAFINDTPVSLVTLKELTEQLVYIHSQHQTLALKQVQFQLNVLDAVADTSDLALEVKLKVTELRKLENELLALKENLAAQQREIEFARFQYNELTEHRLDELDYVSFEAELAGLSNVDQLKELYIAISTGIGEDNGPLDRLRLLKVLTEKYKSSDRLSEDFSNRLNSAIVELKELENDAQSAFEKVEADPERLFQLTDSVDKYNKLLSKYGVATQEELLQIQQELAEQLDADANRDERIFSLEQAVSKLTQEITEKSDRLFNQRHKAAKEVVVRIENSLKELKMADAKIVFDLQRKNELDSNGGMTVQCLFSANAGMELKSIEKAASGGELSRLMLAIQAELSHKKGLPTLILDEIDTGVSGDVASRVARFLAKIGQNIQCVVVTHLPQVAAKATHHLEVSKSNAQTAITPLNDQDRLEAIAKMMSGESVTEAALANAKELILAD
jgi:DNA repair protein RecN (Recombination protein N)